MSESSEELVGDIRTRLQVYGDTLSGWSYDDGNLVGSNMSNLVDTLYAKIKADAERIDGLLTKLGLLVERGP